MKPEIAFITGASRGIGHAIATGFAKAGFALAINCRQSAAELERFATELSERFHIPCLPLIGDVSDENFVNHAFETIEKELGAVTILINNAGISHIGLLSDMSLEEWNLVLGTNLTSLFFCCRRAIPNMVNSKSGRILNISSVWGNTGASCEVAYSASKGGVNAFTKALAKELAPSSIRVNALACGAIATQMNNCFTEEELTQFCEEIPACRLGQQEEIAQMVWLLYNSPSYLTGEIIKIDGGYL